MPYKLRLVVVASISLLLSCILRSITLLKTTRAQYLMEQILSTPPPPILLILSFIIIFLGYCCPYQVLSRRCLYDYSNYYYEITQNSQTYLVHPCLVPKPFEKSDTHMVKRLLLVLLTTCQEQQFEFQQLFIQNNVGGQDFFGGGRSCKQICACTYVQQITLYGEWGQCHPLMQVHIFNSHVYNLTSFKKSSSGYTIC